MNPIRDIDVVLLAAGLSKRMGDENKLLLPFDGVPLVRHTARTILASGCRHLIDNRPADVHAAEMNNSAFVRDIDTAADYGRAVAFQRPAAPCCG